MDVFLVVHEMAVVGSALFLMAVSSLWYSDVLFGKSWLAAINRTAEDMTADRQWVLRSLGYTFVAYVVLLTILSVVLHYATLLQVDRLWVPTLMVLIYVAFLTNHVVWEGRSWRYWGISVGFAAVFLYVGTWLLTYWPW